MKIERHMLGFIKTNAYIGINEELKEAFVVDPGTDEGRFVDHFEREGLTLKGILLTHGHFDHIGGVEALVAKYGCPVYALEEERELLATPSINLSTTIRRPMSVTDIVALQDGQTLEVAGIQIQVLATPGHTVGGVCYYVEERGVVFAGDTLFLESVGRSDFPGGSASTLVRSIREKLFVLPEDTIVYPGHMDETTIEHEKKCNPFVG